MLYSVMLLFPLDKSTEARLANYSAILTLLLKWPKISEYYILLQFSLMPQLLCAVYPEPSYSCLQFCHPYHWLHKTGNPNSSRSLKKESFNTNLMKKEISFQISARWV